MVREIKFRAQEVNTGNWSYGATISEATVKRKKGQWFMEVSENKWVGVIPETIGQFTGYRDSDLNNVIGVNLNNEIVEKKKLNKRHNHSHFWIGNGLLFESYNTIRGIRYNIVTSVNGMRDTDRCTPELIEHIEEKYMNNTSE